MKATITILGLAVLTFTNANAAIEFKSQDLIQQELTTLNVENTQEFSNTTVENNGYDAVVFDPNSVIATTYAKTVEDVIAENKTITETQEEEVLPLSLGYTIEDRIAEDNQIIESTTSNEVLPLDFEKINHTLKSIKANNNAIITADLKL
jgi:hypothetical protein